MFRCKNSSHNTPDTLLSYFEICTERELAVKYCLDCKSFLGQCCADQHSSIYDSLNHKVLLIPNDLRCFPVSSNNLYLYCDDCKILLCSANLVDCHLSNNDYVKTLDSECLELKKDLQKVQLPQNDEENAIRKMLTDEHIPANLNIAPDEIADEIARADLIINSRKEIREENDFRMLYRQYWYAIKRATQPPVKQKLIENFIVFLKNSISAVLSCKNTESALIFAPMLKQSVQNPEIFSQLEIHNRSQLPPEVIAAEKADSEAITVAIHCHPTNEGDSDKTPEQERAAFVDDMNNHCDEVINIRQ